MIKIWSFGIAMLDIVTQPVIKWPEIGGAEVTDTTDLVIGGMALNSAVSLAKIGKIEVGLIGCIGQDPGGQVVKNELDKLGVDLDRLFISSQSPTGVAICCVHPGGERSFFLCYGANNELSIETANLEDFKKGDFFHVGGAMGMEKTNGLLLADILKKVRSQGLTISVDTIWDGTGKWWSLLEPCLPYTDILMTNDDEAKRYSGCDTLEEAAGKFLSYGPKTVLIKLGDQGVKIFSNEWSSHIDVFDVDAVDATGAGDAFAAGVLFGLAHGWGLEQACIFGSAAGAKCVTAYGATTGIEDYNQTISFIEENGRAGDWNWILE